MRVIKPEQKNSLCTTDGGTEIKSCYLIVCSPLSSWNYVRPIHISTLSRQLRKLEPHSDPTFPLLEMVKCARLWKAELFRFQQLKKQHPLEFTRDRVVQHKPYTSRLQGKAP